MAGLMDKILADGQLTRTPYIVSGRYKGYYLTIHMNQGFTLRINYALAENMDLASFKNRAYGVLNQLRVAEKKVSQTNVGDHMLEVKILPANFAKNTIATVDSVTNHLIGFLQAEGAGTGCEICGKEFEISGYDVNNTYHYLCANCARESMSQLEAERQSKLSVKSNLLLGFIGALIGSLIGVALWVFIFQAGYIAGLAGILIFMGAMKGYEILGKNVDRKGVVVCILITVVMIFLANEGSIRLAVYLAAQDQHMHMSFEEINRSWSRFMRDDDFKLAYFKDLFIGYLLAGIALFSTAKQAFRSAGGSYTMKRM